MGQGTIDTPVGALTVYSQEGKLTRVSWTRGRFESAPEIDAALSQLEAYFSGDLTEFDLPIDVQASEFQRDVCDAMRLIPFGETRTYGELAQDLGAPAQAIGGACGGNPLPVIIPCHRVLGANSLGGYSGHGGVETKIWLLRHEGAAGLLI